MKKENRRAVSTGNESPGENKRIRVIRDIKSRMGMCGNDYG